MKKDEYKYYKFILDDETHQELRRLAFELRRSMSDIIRELVKNARNTLTGTPDAKN